MRTITRFSSPCSSAGASPPPEPSSAFIFGELVVHLGAARELATAGGRCRPGPRRAGVRSSNAPACSSSSTADARARIVSVLSSARCIARPRSAISSPTPLAASEIRTWASAAEYCALMTSFLVRNCSIFCAQLLLVRRSAAPAGASSSLTCWSSDCSSVCASVLRSSAVRARSSRPWASAWRACVSSLTTCCSSFCGLHLKALLRRDDVGDALLDVLKQLDLLLVAVVERLARVLGPVEHLRDLRLDDGGHASGKPWHVASSSWTRVEFGPRVVYRAAWSRARRQHRARSSAAGWGSPTRTTRATSTAA